MATPVFVISFCCFVVRLAGRRRLNLRRLLRFGKCRFCISYFVFRYQSPCPESNRNLPFTRRVLDLSSCGGRMLAVRSKSSPAWDDGAPARAGMKIRFVRVRKPGLFRLVPKTSASTSSATDPLFPIRDYSSRSSGSGWIRTNISIACMTFSEGRTSSNERNRTSESYVQLVFARPTHPWLIVENMSLVRVRKPSSIAR